jgi:hypothetical protein
MEVAMTEFLLGASAFGLLVVFVFLLIEEVDKFDNKIK